jgi:protein-tyrosine phosphatase
MIVVCFVCLGNICRSPTAEAVMRHLVESEGLEHAISVDSAGTSRYHIGESPDPRAQAAGRRRGMRVGGRARQFGGQDWKRCDYVMAMDQDNYQTLVAAAPSPEAARKVYLFRAFDPGALRGASVPDPYYGGAQGFDDVVDICESAARGLIAHIRKEHGI